MRVAFWGVRGSCPTPHPSVLRYGGNTPCVEVRVNGHLFILDAGTGLRNLVGQLAAEDASPGLTSHLLLSHYHWAHIQGLPFLEPLWQAGSTVPVYGPWTESPGTPSLGALLRNLFSAPFFSGDAERAQSAFAARELAPESDIRVGSAWVRTCPTHHPGGALAYRIDHQGSSLVYAPDHEPGNDDYDRRLVSLARGTDLFICDAHCDPLEFSDAANARGHGSWRAAVALAREAEARHLALFHHAPQQSDTEVDSFVSQARRSLSKVVAAGEGMIVNLEPGQTRFWACTGRASQRVSFPVTAQIEPVQPEPPGAQQVHLQDISLQGAYFVGGQGQTYDVNQPLNMLIEFPPEGGREPTDKDAGEPTAALPPLRLRGTVTRVEPHPAKAGSTGVGVRFSESPAVDIVRLPGNRDDRQPD